jgi:hypothetical protein
MHPESLYLLYMGSLPKYAKKPNRARVVKLWCKMCTKSRWAQMNKRYPGEQALRKAPLGEFRAKCLYCGLIDRDNKRWYLP